MKASTMIQILQRVMDQDGDVEVSIYVKDYFSRYGSEAEILEVDLNSGIWTGIFRMNTLLRFNAYLKKDPETGKQPKVTFRKTV